MQCFPWQQVKKCCRSDCGYTFINAQNGVVKSLERKFFQFTKRMQYLTGKKNTQQATGNAAETLFNSLNLH